jgi:hypothetical protein
MKDIPIINNYIKNKKSQKKLDELFNKPIGPFNSKYNMRFDTNDIIKNEIKTITDTINKLKGENTTVELNKLKKKLNSLKSLDNTKINEVDQIKAEITRLESNTNDYKTLNNNKITEIKTLKEELEKIDKQIYDLHSQPQINCETELVKQQNADYNKEIYMNKMYFDKLDIILTMAEYISNIKDFDKPAYLVNRFTYTVQTLGGSGCDIFIDNRAKSLCYDKENYIYPETNIEESSDDEDVVNANVVNYIDDDTNCNYNIKINNETVEPPNIGIKSETIDSVEFKIPKNRRLYNRQIQEYLNSNDYYLNRFSDSYI